MWAHGLGIGAVDVIAGDEASVGFDVLDSARACHLKSEVLLFPSGFDKGGISGGAKWSPRMGSFVVKWRMELRWVMNRMVISRCMI